MTSTPIRSDEHGYLVDCRQQVVSALDGLDEYEIRHPMTPTGTNLLGVVKHLIGIEAGYLGACLGRPFAEPLPWLEDESLGPNRDLWATADESRADLLALYARACAHSDAVLAELGREAPARVPWWPEGARATTGGALLARVLKDTAMHAGQLQILRELIDGRAGADQGDLDPDGWRAHTDRLERIALEFRRPDGR